MSFNDTVPFNAYNTGFNDTYSFRPQTTIDMLVDRLNAAVEAQQATTPRIIEVDRFGCSYITYPVAPPTEDVSVQIQLGEHKIVAEFASKLGVSEEQATLADQLSGYADTQQPVVVGPLIIPARNVPAIVFASVRTMDDASSFGVHQYGNGSFDGE